MTLDIEQLSFGFTPSRKVLNNISLHIQENKTIAIVGASGCGKSTFLRLLCGIIQKKEDNFWEGKITIDTLLPEQYTQAGKAGFMFQEPTLMPNLTVKENIALPLKLKNIQDFQRVDEMISTVGLQEFADYLPKSLSGGMKTRVALARTFITKPSLLLLDEPFSSLDVRWRFALYRELEKLKAKYEPTVVVVTHDIQEALLLANHILVFGQGGRILKEIILDKKLPRVFEKNAFADLQEEYILIQQLIMEDVPF